MNESICKRCGHRDVCYRCREMNTGKKTLIEFFSTEATCPDYYSLETVETNMYDIVERYEDCTVEVLKNSITGEVSIGWFKNDSPPFPISV